MICHPSVGIKSRGQKRRRWLDHSCVSVHEPKALYVLSETEPRIWLEMRSSRSLSALGAPIGLNGTSTHTSAHQAWGLWPG